MLDHRPIPAAPVIVAGPAYVDRRNQRRAPMPLQLEGEATSIWIDTAPATSYPPLRPGVHVDVAILGGGIAGLTAATLIKRDGATVAVVEAGRVGAGVTGHTTAKISALQGTIYQSIRSGFGVEGARTYAQANAAGLDLIARLVEELSIDCDLRRRPALTYAERSDDRDKLEREAEATRAAGLATTLEETIDLPWAVACALRLDDQAEFHPRRYLLGLAETIPGAGSHVFEQTRATAVAAASPARITTTRAELTADQVIVATHVPFLDRGGYFARMHAERSYALGVHVAGEVPRGMYLSTESPAHSVRAAPTAAGEMLILGGEGHKTGQGGSTAERVARLEHWARDHFDVREIAYRWSTQDCMSADGVPYVGRLAPFGQRLWVATGFMKWGMTNAGAAAMILADLIAGRESPCASLFNSTRFGPLASAANLVKENADVARHFFGDHLARPELRSAAQPAPGEGALVRGEGGKVAAYRAEDGTIEAVSPVCTHFGCSLRWNSAETSWDCPCHGSRFATDGRVLEGPAVKDLEPRRAN
ncbi:MAG: FAD-dependent oxidoreductase [Thermoleophilaceae bacterium]